MISDNMHHQKFMQIALNLAQSGKGATAPNPSVGAVLVHDGHVLASARTANGGRPHAETQAIHQAKAQLKTTSTAEVKLPDDTHLYVTLEPCTHQGVTPACVDAIISNSISKVVIGLQDADSRVTGNGVQKLRNANIEVCFEPLAGAIADFYQGYQRQRMHGKPFVAMKLATSLEGKIALHNGQSQWITGALARKMGHLLRARADCVLTGAGTILADNARLNCRIDGFSAYGSMRALIIGQRKIDADRAIFNPQDGKLMLIISEESTDKDYYQQLAQQYADDVTVHFLPAVNVQTPHLPSLHQALNLLGRLGMTDILLEAGAILSTALLQENLIDRIYWLQNHRIIGNDGVAGIGALNIRKLQDTQQFQCRDSQVFSDNGDQLLILDRQITA